jgi:hypothetical protein
VTLVEGWNWRQVPLRAALAKADQAAPDTPGWRTPS